MSRRVLGGLGVLGVVLVTGVILVAVYVPGDNITRTIAVLGFIVAAAKTGYDVWEKERERLKKHEVANSPIELKVHDVFFRFKGRDAGGGDCETTRVRAEYVGYWFKLSAFNSRAENVGLSDITLHYAKGGDVVHEQTPTEHTGQISAGRSCCPDGTTLTLPAREWLAVTFQGGTSKNMLPVISECDEIYLTAKSTTGEAFRVQLASNIIETA